jgi:hypothetical protein
MAIIKPAARIIVRESAAYHFSGPALSLGVSEVYATPRELEQWFPELAGRACPLKPEDVTLTMNETGRRLGWATADTFFKSLGVSDVTTMDIPGCEHAPDLIHDLNQPLPQELTNRFNLVLDPGTMEHVFDTKTGLTNIVRALKVGGTIVQEIPIYSYNGGYYSFNPNVLNDFYSQNGFAEIKTFIIMWDRYRAYTGKHRCYEYTEELFGGRHAVADHDQCRFAPHLLLIARKIEELPEIRVPLQFEGHYVEQGHDPHRGNQGLLAKIKQRSLPLLFSRPMFPLTFYLQSWVTRNAQLRRTRRKSFWM